MKILFQDGSRVDLRKLIFNIAFIFLITNNRIFQHYKQNLK